MNQNLVSYSEAVAHLRSDSEKRSLIEEAYLDQNLEQAWERFRNSEEWAEVCDLLNLHPHRQPISVLDVGCGNGIASVALMRKGARVIAFDPDGDGSVGCGALRRAGFADDVPERSLMITRGFAEAMPFKDCSFDLVYGRQVLHHFLNLERGISECARVLKPGGRAIFCREHVVNDAVQLADFLKGHPLHKFHGGENAHTLQQYLAAFEAAGLVVVRTLAPFDSVINHFPTSNTTVEEWLRVGLQKRVGVRVGSLLAKVFWVQRLFRRRLSRQCAYPGRLYSFLVERPSTRVI